MSLVYEVRFVGSDRRSIITEDPWAYVSTIDPRLVHAVQVRAGNDWGWSEWSDLLVTPVSQGMDLPRVDPQFQLDCQRQLTSWYISIRPKRISFIPHQRVKTPAGGFTTTSIAPRDPQTVTVFMESEEGNIPGEGGYDRQFEGIVVGEWDAQIAKDDQWVDDDGDLWVVYDIFPYNGYEVKGRVRKYG